MDVCWGFTTEGLAGAVTTHKKDTQGAETTEQRQRHRRQRRKKFNILHPAWDSNPQPPDFKCVEVWRATIAPAGLMQV
jgi:hypothetical protein